jgi:hypothetical protein
MTWGILEFQALGCALHRSATYFNESQSAAQRGSSVLALPVWLSQAFSCLPKTP